MGDYCAAVLRWDGVELADLPAEMLERPEADASEKKSSGGGLFSSFRGREAEAWSDPRLTVMEQIWGEGMTSPGDRDFIMAMITTLGIDKKMAVVEIGAGLGGSTRIIVKETGARVTGLEPSATFAEAGAELLMRHGLKKKATIEHCDLSNLGLEPGCTPVIFSLDSFYKAPEKTEFYGSLYRALKGDGQLLFTDYMVPEAIQQGDKYEQWAAKEDIAPQPWTIDETRSSLEYHGFEVRIAEDITRDYCGMALRGLNEFAGELKPGRMDKSMVAAVLDVVEQWSLRLALLEAGQLAVYRVYARKNSEADH